jgi:cyclase
MPSLKPLAVGLAATVTLVALAAAQQPAQPLSVKLLKADTFWTQGGSGGNTGIIIGTTGVIVVDAKTTPDSAKEMLAEIAKLTPKPVTHVILTHSDGDHVNGLAAFPMGLTIIAHEGNKKEMDTALAAGGRGAPPADHMPTQVVTSNSQALTIDGVKVTLLHWAPAHTSGDLVVYLPDQKIVFTGDIISGALTADPNVHLEKNGTAAGWVTTAKGIGALDADQFVPGHGDLQTKANIQARVASVEDKEAKIAAMIKDGKSVADIKTALGVPPPPAAAAGGRGPAPTFIDVVYQELTKK